MVERSRKVDFFKMFQVVFDLFYEASEVPAGRR